jgi:hypothetical protein
MAMVVPRPGVHIGWDYFPILYLVLTRIPALRHKFRRP